MPIIRDPYVLEALDPGNTGTITEFAQGSIVFKGWCSDSPLGAAYQRIYLTPDLSEFIDVLAIDILGNALSGSAAPAPRVIWVKDTALIRHTRNESLTQQSSFLNGPITGGSLQNAVAQVGGGLVLMAVTLLRNVLGPQNPAGSISGFGCGGTGGNNVTCS